MRRIMTYTAVLCAALTVWSCKPATPEEQVAAARGRYSVKLNGFFVKEEPAPVEPAAADEGAEGAAEAVAAAAAADEAAVAAEEGEEGEPAAPEAPRGVDVLLDLIVQHDMDDALPGVTVDLTMVDAERNEKDAWKIWIETAGLPKANQKQVTHVLEDIAYEEGDAFTVEIRSPVPASEYGDYREFASAAP